MEYEAVIGLEVHAELLTASKMFCSCPVVDVTQAAPNTAICPVCAGLPGVLPVVNARAVEYGLRVALALRCSISPVSIFARKNYFYPDLPKGYQISQYEQPLAAGGGLSISTPQGERTIRIRRVHLEEDTGKLTHLSRNGEPYSLVDLNRAGIPLLEIVSEPDLHTLEEVRSYAMAVRSLLRSLEVNSGDMEKGVIRFEANVSLRPSASRELGTRVEIKNLNSFRAMERAVAYQLEQQAATLQRGEQVRQETLGWNEEAGSTYPQRSKEEAHDYRYFPEPDLPPLAIEPGWVERVAASLPELPAERRARFQAQYGLSGYLAGQLAEERALADYFEAAVQAAQSAPAQTVAHWMAGELFAWIRQSGQSIERLRVSPQMLAGLLEMLESQAINAATAKAVLSEMLETGRGAAQIVAERRLLQVSDAETIAALVRRALEEHPQELAAYRAGKPGLFHWFFGQVMRLARGQANPTVVQQELEQQLAGEQGRPPDERAA